MRKGNNLNEEEHIFCKEIKSISSYKTKIVFRKHTHKINHVDLQKNLLMTSGDDDLIIIVDLAILKYIFQYYDIINGTSFCRFLDPLSSTSSTRIIYYGPKSFKLYIYDYIKNEILLIVNLLRESLYHLEYKGKSNLLVTSQENNCIIWKLNENNMKACYKLKNSYYAIIDEEKRHIISAAIKYKNEIEYSSLSIYRYDNNRDLNMILDHEMKLDLDYNIEVMNLYKTNEYYFLLLISEFNFDIIQLDDDTFAFQLSLGKNKNLKFSYIEPVFTKEILLGFNNGNVELVNPFWDKERIKQIIEVKNKKKENINKFIKEVKDNEPKHEESVVQIKVSDYYPFYVSIADEMIIYQLKE